MLLPLLQSGFQLLRLSSETISVAFLFLGSELHVNRVSACCFGNIRSELTDLVCAQTAQGVADLVRELRFQSLSSILRVSNRRFEHL